MPDPAAVVRRFNRSYTQRIGALEDSFLGMGMPLGPARLLFEIGTEPGSVRQLRERRQRRRLADALSEADLLVRAATVELTTLAPTDPAAPPRRWGTTSRR